MLTLYVAGDSTHSRRVRETLQAIVADAGLQVDVCVIDVLRYPELGTVNGIVVTPTLVASIGDRQQALVGGDLARRDKLLEMLSGLPLHAPTPAAF